MVERASVILSDMGDDSWIKASGTQSTDRFLLSRYQTGGAVL